ncbi:MAG: glycogen synthase GlgA [Bradyrhizobiaceae bacterium]|nr:MAG: glycogen synthase GlgA [Bradyrhizobiaceae bacterium]
MRVLFVSAEIFPLAKTGGLADVSAALPQALVQGGMDVRLVLPAYPRALALATEKEIVAELPDATGSEPLRVIAARIPDSGLPVWLVDAPNLYDRPGTPYLDEAGCDWPDNARRFATFSRVAAKIALGEVDRDWHADVVHANDWHTGLLPLLIGQSTKERPPTIFTIHNLAYQGLFPHSVLPVIGLPDGLFTPDGVEYYGRVSFMKAGIRFSQAITTVSPSYAQEILTADYGCGLDGLLNLRRRDITGILNGVDYSIWDPAHDPHLPVSFDVGNMAGKLACKEELQRELGLTTDPAVPLVVWLSRITDQKMADVVARTLHRIFERDVQLAVLGDGEPALEAEFRDAAAHYPGRLAVRIGYREELAHRHLAGADLLLHPSRFEPCGLTPLYAMRYGAVPIVRHVGGMSDTIVDTTEWTAACGCATGFAFAQPNADALLDCLDRALAFYGQRSIWSRIQQRAMSRRFGWAEAAKRYSSLYRKLAPDTAAVIPERPPERLVPAKRMALVHETVGAPPRVKGLAADDPHQHVA